MIHQPQNVTSKILMAHEVMTTKVIHNMLVISVICISHSDSKPIPGSSSSSSFYINPLSIGVSTPMLRFRILSLEETLSLTARPKASATPSPPPSIPTTLHDFIMHEELFGLISQFFIPQRGRSKSRTQKSRVQGRSKLAVASGRTPNKTQR